MLDGTDVTPRHTVAVAVDTAHVPVDVERTGGARRVG